MNIIILITLTWRKIKLYRMFIMINFFKKLINFIKIFAIGNALNNLQNMLIFTLIKRKDFIIIIANMAVGMNYMIKMANAKPFKNAGIVIY